MQTLKELIEAKKCRKGQSSGITSDGAYWLAIEPVKIRSYGGDGVGNNGTNWTHYLELRHYRNGSVECIVECRGWHQNHREISENHVAPLGSAETVEHVIARLKSMKCGESKAYSDKFQPELTAALVSIGMAESLPSPDEA